MSTQRHSMTTMDHSLIISSISFERTLTLSSGEWALAALIAAVLAYVVSAILARRRLRNFDGPFLASFSYIWIARVFLSGQAANKLLQAEARYGRHTRRGAGPGDGAIYGGSTIRIGPNELLTSDPEVIRRTSGARTGYTRSKWYGFLSPDPYNETMLSTLNGALHDKLKAQTAAGYAGRDNPHFEADMDYVISLLVDKIQTKYAVCRGEDDRSKPFLDLGNMAQYFTLDAIAKLGFGEEFGHIREERDIHGHIEMYHDAAAVVTASASVPVLRSILGSKTLLKLVGPKPTDKKGLGRTMAAIKPIIAQRFAPNAEKKQDMLGSFIQHGMTQQECETEALLQIVAGGDTSATSIRAILLFLMSTPRSYVALQSEIDEGIRTGRISSPVTNAEANGLPYLQAVIWETMRLHPPFVGVPYKVVPPGGDTIDGKHVPGGTLIAPNFWATGRNAKVYGPDAEVFRPERWLLTTAGGTCRSEEERAEMRRVAELAFGYGRWGCAGKAFALVELNKVIVELVRRFDMQLVYPWQPWNSVNHNLFLQDSMWVRVTMREGVNGE